MSSATQILQALRRAVQVSDSLCTYVSHSEPPPDPGVNWLTVPRFTFGMTNGPSIEWPLESGRDQRTLPLGEVLFIPAQGWMRVDRSRVSQLMGIVMFPTHVRYLIVKFPGDGKPHPARYWRHTRQPASATVQELLRRLDPSQPQCSNSLATTAVHLLIEHLETDTTTAPTLAGNLHQAICAYIDEHVGEPLDRTSVAAVFDRHPNYISELFKQNGDCGFHAYLTRTRLRRAAELLIHTQQPINAVARAVGYNRPSHFGSVFRKHCGSSPGAYRSAKSG